MTLGPQARSAARPALELRGVCVNLEGRSIVRGASWTFAAGRVHAVIGRSGVGKSVLFKAAAGLLPRTKGTIHVHRPPLVFVHQDPALIDTLDVEENVSFAVERSGLPRDETRARVDDALRLLRLTSWRRRPVSSLSIAQQKRVALARAMCLRPGVLIVDEPTTGLDPVAAQAVDAAVADLPRAHDTTLVVVTHSPRTLERLAPDIVVMREGRLHPVTSEAA